MNAGPAHFLEKRFALATTNVQLGERQLTLVRPRSIDELIDEEDFELDERLPYWADLWPSALVLAERLIGESGQGRKLLELGCGLGLVSLAAAMIGFEVLATDYYREALEFTAVNAARNELADKIDTRLVDWRRWPDDLESFDLVVASDVLFDRPNPALVAGALARSLAPGGLALVTDPSRQVAATFHDECERRGLKAECALRLPRLDGKTAITVELHEVRWQETDR